ncbi:hypothetical protein KKG83_08095 [Candidatus Micrarchaeota archaeon]|nr:hypothetical protein [Candidatus Micrarchaeota archaeon]
MKVLIPLLSRKELNEEFLEKALKGTHEIVLLMVIDKEDSPKASDISSATHFMEEVKKAVGKKRKRCEEFTEWGETSTKIKNTAILNKADKIVMLKQENQYFEELVEKLKEDKEIKEKIELIEVKQEVLPEKKETEKQVPEKTEEKPLLEKKQAAKTKDSEKKQAKKLGEWEKTIAEQLKKQKEIADKLLKKGFNEIKKIRFR